MIIKHSYSGKNLLELRKQFGIDSSGFYGNDWWLKEKFASEKAPKGIYEIDTEKKLTNKTYDEQESELKDWDFPHPAVLAEAILTHYKKTNERLLENWYSRTSSVVSYGDRVYVGYFSAYGLYVSSSWGGDRSDRIGVASAGKFKKNLESLKTEPFDPLSLEIKIGKKNYKLVEN